jgi:hypothetical protein
MSTLVKIAVALAVVLPLGAFVVGSLAASGAEDPGPRQTIVLRDPPSPEGRASRSATPTTGPGDHGGTRVITPSPDDLDDHGDDSGRDGSGDDHGGSATPTPTPSTGDDHGGHGSEDSGHGGGHG